MVRSLCGYIAQQTSPKKASSINISRTSEPTGGCCPVFAALCLAFFQDRVAGVEVVSAVFVGRGTDSGVSI